MEETAISIEDILKENERRIEERDRIYDPVHGDPADKRRFLFQVPGAEPLWIPLSMKKDLEAEELMARLLSSFGKMSAAEKEILRKRLDRIRCRHDFPYWAATRAYIKRKGGGGDTLFVLNSPQRKLVDKLEDMRLTDAPIRLVLLKARQWGASTCVQLYMAWLQLEHQTGLNSLIIAHYHSATEEIKDMYDRMLHYYRPDGDYAYSDDEKEEARGRLHTERVGRSGLTMKVTERNCKVKVSTAQTPDGSRGGDYNLVHCSEVGLWKSTRLLTPEQVLRATCSGVLFKPMTMIVMESTANGAGTFFHREYESAKRGESQFRHLFIAWHEIEQYSLPFPNHEKKAEFARQLLEGRESTLIQHNRCQSGRYLWRLWKSGATLEAINWYVAERAKYNDPHQMAAEYPSDDIEAFAHSGAAVFDKYKVEALKDGCREPLARGEVSGDGSEGAEALLNLRFDEDLRGGLAVWRFPETDTETRVTDRYVAVVDIGGRSASADWSVIAVFDREPMRRGEGPEVAAQWRGHCDFDLLAWNAARIAAFYDEALLVIESNTIETHEAGRMMEGDQSSFLFERLRDAYPRLYARSRRPEEIRAGAPLKYGFHTNTATKPLIISNLVKVIREGSYIERDQNCLDEYLAYERKQNGSYGAIDGHHDDILMTRAIGLHIAVNEMPFPIITERGASWRTPGYTYYES